MRKLAVLSLACLTIAALAAAVLAADSRAAEPSAAAWAARPWAGNVVVPQARAFALPNVRAVEITGVEARVEILEQAATTTLDISLRNPGGARAEAELAVPVPEGAVVRGFSFQGAAKEPTARLLPREEADRTYRQIVASMRDPALLEFIGCNLIRSSVFPVEPGGAQKVRLVYEQVLRADGDRVDYLIPRTQSLEYSVPWDVLLTVKAKRAIATVYSPSHRLETVRAEARAVTVRLSAEARTEPGPFQLSYLLERAAGGPSASLLAYPDPKTGGGYFLLLAGLPPRADGAAGREAPGIRREVTVVLDRSGSMGGEKMEQARKAALQVLEGLAEGEAFNVIAYNEGVSPFADRPVAKNAESIAAVRKFIARIAPSGGTNIHDALVEALRPKPAEGMLPIVLFLTDGLPTVGTTSESAIRELAEKGNPHKRRIFTFGVGTDVNAPLLDRIAADSRASATYVLPREDVEVKVGQVFRRLYGPVLAGPELAVLGRDDRPARDRLSDVLPARLPDLFDGDQLVLLGRYSGTEPVTFVLSGQGEGRRRTFRFAFDFEGATTRNAFVPRLWASRRIAVLVEAIRAAGADGAAAATVTADPRMKELVDEIVRLSTEFGILTEYTAFLAREGTDLGDRGALVAEARGNLDARAVRTRSGQAAVNQSLNLDHQSKQSWGNRRNAFYDANLNRVSVANVQQVGDLAFYRQGDRWVDGRVASGEKPARAARTVEFGSAEFAKLVEALARDNRQGAVALGGELVVKVGDEVVLVKGPGKAGKSGKGE